MNAVALEAGVSVSTVSHVLNKTRVVDRATAARVHAAVDKLGYRKNDVARAMARGRTQTVGVAVASLTNPNTAVMLASIAAAITELGVMMLVGETGGLGKRENQLVNALLDRRVDGVILEPSADATNVTLPLLERTETPSVLLAGSAKFPRGYDQIGPDISAAVAALVDHLTAAHGHRHIALLIDEDPLTPRREGTRAFTQALTRRGLDDGPSRRPLVRPTSAGVTSAIFEMINQATPPTALITGSPHLTTLAVAALNEHRTDGSNHISVCALDDFASATVFRPSLTAVEYPWSEIGERAVRSVISRVETSDQPHETWRLSGSMRVRQSCGCSGTAES